ncbi:MAG: NADPH:quinone reductase [Sedimentibacter sp.]|jgi:NADPH2:quinone reductase|nr:NADPH:quinone reductase [Sedimentibacter sp.]
MKAMVINKFGGPEVFELMDIPKPEVKPGYVLVRVIASSLNPFEIKLRSGLLPEFAPPFPAVLNSDVSGIVVKVGENVELLRPGDEVYGFIGGMADECGALAEYALVDEELLSIKPNNIDFKTAALFPLVGISAYRAIMENSHIKQGDKVLIQGAAGGVGHIAVQFAKMLNAEVYATVSSDEKAEIATHLGADYVINYKTTEVKDYVDKYTEGKGFDVVFDTIGASNLINSFIAAKVGGLVLTTNSRATVDLTLLHHKSLTLKTIFMVMPIFTKTNRNELGNILNEMKKMIEEGNLTIFRDKAEFEFTDISKAHEYYEAGDITAKISLLNNLI